MMEIEKVIYVEVPVKVKVGYQKAERATSTYPGSEAEAMPGDVVNHDEIGAAIDKAILETDWLSEISDDLEVLVEDAVDSLDFDEIPDHLFAANFA